jgi:hypothetical protein
MQGRESRRTPGLAVIGKSAYGSSCPLESWAGLARAGCPCMSLCQDFLAVASYCSTTLAGMRPRPLTAMPCSFAQARMSPLRCRLDAGRGRRCPRPALRACSTNSASCFRNAAACFLFRSISYSVPPNANRTVSSAGPPSRSSSSAMVILRCHPGLLDCAGLSAPYKINCHAVVPATCPLPASPTMHSRGTMSAPVAADDRISAGRRHAGAPCGRRQLCAWPPRWAGRASAPAACTRLVRLAGMTSASVAVVTPGRRGPVTAGRSGPRRYCPAR